MNPITDLTTLRDALREFCAARDWHRYHTPKNLVMALSVEAAELVEHFQWATPSIEATHFVNIKHQLTAKSLIWWLHHGGFIRIYTSS